MHFGKPLSARGPRHAVLMVIDPSGNKSRMPVAPLPFKIGRQGDNQLVLRDVRISRNHARIFAEGADYLIEDLGSRHGVFVNGTRVERRKLRTSDRIDFGLRDSYQLIFSFAGAEVSRLLEKFPEPAKSSGTAAGNLTKLRALLDVARTVETSLSIDEVLVAVVDAALAVTGAERGFLLLRQGESLETRVARDRHGAALPEADLRVPRQVIYRALTERTDLLSMNFDPSGTSGLRPDQTVAALDLRSVVAVPLVRTHPGGIEEGSAPAGPADDPTRETVGLLYMDSRAGSADLAAGNRELLEALALEASTVLENARLLEEERAKQRMDKELGIARQIQESLQPRRLPDSGWFRAAGRSIPSQQVGGDYFDVHRIDASCWAAVVADVSGKGVSSALLASLLQGAFLGAVDGLRQMEETLARINRFLLDRTEGGKYATILYAILHESGTLRWINAGHCIPLLVSPRGELSRLATTGMPVGMFEDAVYAAQEIQVEPGSKAVIYTDGVTEACNPAGEFFGEKRIRQTVIAHAAAGCRELCEALQQALEAFTGSAPQSDDITLLVVEYGSTKTGSCMN